MNRADFQQLADVRVTEAAALLAAGCWDGAYYLAGYAVECGLKACILVLVERTGIIFQDKKFSEKCWTHDPEVLLALADLKTAFDHAAAADPALGANWETVTDWTEARRYERVSEADARNLFAAVTDPAHGVLSWIKRYW